MMHIDDNSPPDGTLSVRQLARDTINDSREHFYTTSECVWLERNLITDHQNVPRSVLPKAEETPTLYKIMWDNMFGQTTALENVRAAQMYRTLTTDERAQFQHKQKCLKEKLLQPTQPETCAH
ncbi:MAG TPA: hypothetical protein ENJ46_03015 [Hellea balneolensis]|uniref:Uncharacterized protein n=1 Tax=Hellea balneolensis TaxID=287478 RepID=A0A7C3FZ58_9PROT|nr:hypothetical protein [Hellea balneolensis]